jgi:hypothetical protein
MRFVTGSIHSLLNMPPRFWAAFFVVTVAACASGPPELPYPAFIQSSDLNNVYLATMPGVYAKQLAGDPKTRRTSNRIDLPPGWQGTTGGAPGKALEIFVLTGDLDVGDVRLGIGGYAHVPPGTFGFNLKTAEGARILYFLDDVDPMAMIETPTILDTGLVGWQPTDIAGVSVKVLRDDPGNGARTWLKKVEPGAVIPWQASSAIREGYLANGHYQDSECVNGESHTWTYTQGGYFYRPGKTLNGGPEAKAIAESIWVLREAMASSKKTAEICAAEPIS